MRSLVITPTPTHPAEQGNRARVAQIASALRCHGPVEVLYSAVDGAHREVLDMMRAAWDGLHVVPPSNGRPIRRVASHWGLDEWVSPQLIRAVETLAATTHFDVVVANYVWCSLLLECFTSAETLRVLDTHDVFAQRHDLARAAGLRAHWFSTTHDEETRGLNRADIVLAIQPDEARDFASRCSAHVELVEFAMPPRTVPARPPHCHVIGYFGSGNPWIVASLMTFDRLLADRSPGGDNVRFVLLGGITRAVSDLRVFQPVGMVRDVADAYAVVDLVVNPMIGGTGLKIKTVEALAHGRPVLSTADGGAGLESCGPDLTLANLPAMVDRLTDIVATDTLPDLAAQQVARYAAFHADVSRRLDRLVAGWATGTRAEGQPVIRATRPDLRNGVAVSGPRLRDLDTTAHG